MGDLVVEAMPRVNQQRTLVRKQLKGQKVSVDRPDLPRGSLVAAVDMGSTTLAGYLIDLASGEIWRRRRARTARFPMAATSLRGFRTPSATKTARLR